MRVVLLCSEDFSLGITSLSAYLKSKGYEVKVIFDPKQFEKSYSQNEFLSNFFNRRDLILRQIEEYKPGIVGFSVFTSNYQWALGMARAIKRITKIPVIFGGVHATLVPEIVITEDAVDMVCVGEGEEPLTELLQCLKLGKMDYSIKNIWFKKDGEIIKNEIRPLIHDIDVLPFPDRDALYAQLPRSYSKYPIVLTSYGCPYRCTYCANNAISTIYKGKGKYLRRRSPGHVIAELKDIKSRYKPKYIIFMDDLFTFDKEWFKEFAPMYAIEIGLPYSCLSHTKFLDNEVCELLKQSGCNLVLLGLQSGSEHIRREVLKRPETNDEYRKATRRLKKLGIKFSLDNILNIPFDTENTIKESLEFYNELRPDIIHSFDLIYFPKTEMINQGIKAGMLEAQAADFINIGLFKGYMNLQFSSLGNFRKYALLFTSLPLFPPSIVKKIINSPKWMNFLERLPMIFVLIAKFIINVRVGTGFIFFTVLRNEWFYLRNTVYQKWILRQGLDKSLN